jgi:nitrite reductase (NO-forming)
VTLRCSLAFIVAAGLATAGGASRWLAVHLVLAGGVVLAISGVSLMLAVTWSASPAPRNGAVFAQRLLIGAGAAGVGIARSADAADAWVGIAGALYVAGLITLAVLLVVTIRHGTERRFDAAAAGYVAALTAGVTGAAAGVTMAAGGATARLRSAHVTLNLLGLIGLVVAATIPHFAATVGRSRMSRLARPRVMRVILSIMVSGLALASGALAGGAQGLAAWGFAAYAAGIGAVLVVLPRPTRRQLRWAGPRLVALWAGALWWGVAVAATGVQAADGRPVLAGPWLAALVLGGYLQILWGSLAYLLPMLRGGGPDHLTTGFAITRSWVGLAAANLTALGAATGAPDLMTWFVGVAWMLDTAWRLGRVGTRRAQRGAT